jgi:hypothetical protein
MTCAELPCDERTGECPLPGGCVVRRFPQTQHRKAHTHDADGKYALAGTKPKATRDPALIQRRRKPLTK